MTDRERIAALEVQVAELRRELESLKTRIVEEGSIELAAVVGQLDAETIARAAGPEAVRELYAEINKTLVTRQRFAEEVGVQPVTVGRWKKAGIIFPEPQKDGRTTAEVFIDDDLLFGRELVAAQYRFRSQGLPSTDKQAAEAEKALPPDVRRRRAAERREATKSR